MSPRIWRIGAFGGAAAGIVYMMVEQIFAALGGKPIDVPFRLFASVVLGERAFAAETSVASATLVGTLVVLISATAFGLVFAGLTHRYPGLAATVGTLIIAGWTYGGGLWLFIFYVLGTLFWPWLTETDPTVQLVSTSVGFGVSLGACFALAGVHRSPDLE